MLDLIEEVGIDGKHSFEDAIIPVEDFSRAMEPYRRLGV